MRSPSDAGERKAVADIETHGWHVIKVLEGGDEPAFAYTVGLQHSFGHPELVVFGLPLDVAHSILNVAGEAIRHGAQYSVGTPTDAFLEDRLCTFCGVPDRQFRNYLGWNLWFYEGPSFSALQIVWADASGQWPWHSAVDAVVRGLQPVLADRAGGDPETKIAG